MHIAICGNIGSGKTTLAEMLSRHYGWRAELESVEDNPYLIDFYQDMNAWAFQLQVHFLTSRFKQAKNIAKSRHSTVQDRTIYEDAHVFAANLYNSGYLNNRDYSTYLSLFNTMIEHVKAPDLLIYLKAGIPKLVGQIQKRAREYERAIPTDYLNNLNTHYEAWVGSYDVGKVLAIDVDHMDFVSKSGDFMEIVSRIDAEGLFT